MHVTAGSEAAVPLDVLFQRLFFSCFRQEIALRQTNLIILSGGSYWKDGSVQDFLLCFGTVCVRFYQTIPSANTRQM